MTNEPVPLERAPARSRKKSQTTKQTIQRLKAVLQSRLAHLESQIDEIGEDITALGNERDIRSTNTLVRTLEKVLELEHKERKQRSSRARQNRKFNDADRAEITRRIENLRLEHQEAAERLAREAAERAEDGLAELGEGGSTSA
jgi:hypothetical protein